MMTRLRLPQLLTLFAALCGVSCTGEREPAVTLAVALLPSEQVPYRAVLDAFTDSTGISVTLIAQQYQQIRNALEAEAIAGRGELDLVELDVHLLGAARTRMRALDMLGFPGSDLEADASAGALPAGRDDEGRHRFLPHRLNWQAMIYDADALGAPPATWEELLEVARSHRGRIGIKAARYEGMVCDLFPFLWQSGGDPMDPTSPGSLEALRFLSDLAPALNTAAQSYRENSILEAQERREILLHFNWPFVVPLLREKGLMGGRLRSAPLPAGPAGHATVLGGGYLGIPTTAPRPEEAAMLLRYLVSPAVQKRLARDLGWFPVRVSGWDAVGSFGEGLQGYLAMRDAVRVRPPIPDYDRLSAIWQDAFSRLLFAGEAPEDVATHVARELHKLQGS